MKKPGLPSGRKCCGCSACHAVCPVDAIDMMPDSEGFAVPRVDEGRCVGCGKCLSACPVLNRNEPRLPLRVCAMRASDAAVRRESSSGGVFTLLAKETIRRGGLVFGAAFVFPGARVAHIEVSTEKDLEKLKGSKYVQSDMGETYKRVGAVLSQGREVLFSGCPCQVAGLKKYLGHDVPNLATVDIICHGVPSPAVWEKYIKDREAEAGSAVEFASMRRNGPWHCYPVEIHFSSRAQTYRGSVSDDSFLKGFFQNYYLRRCCHSCPARDLRSGSDITLGDFWEVSSLSASFDDDTGVSVVLANSERGSGLVNSILPQVETSPSSYDAVCAFNPTLKSNYPPSRKRSKFFREFRKRGFDEFVSDLERPDFVQRAYRLLWWMKRLVVNGEVNRL